jgi:hypothetical protein
MLASLSKEPSCTLSAPVFSASLAPKESGRSRSTPSTALIDHSKDSNPMPWQNQTFFQVNYSLLQHDIGIELYWCSAFVLNAASGRTKTEHKDFGRGEWEIICSCSLTLLLCSWMTLRLNVPAATASSLKRRTRKILWFLLTLIAPEFVSKFNLSIQTLANEGVGRSYSILAVERCSNISSTHVRHARTKPATDCDTRAYDVSGSIFGSD